MKSCVNTVILIVYIYCRNPGVTSVWPKYSPSPLIHRVSWMLWEMVATFSIQDQKYLNTQVSKNWFSWISLEPSFKDVQYLEFLYALVRPQFPLTDNLLLLLDVGSNKGQSQEGQRVYSTEFSITCWCQEKIRAISDKKEVLILNSCECTFCDLLLKSNSRVIHRPQVTRWAWVIDPSVKPKRGEVNTGGGDRVQPGNGTQSLLWFHVLAPGWHLAVATSLL